MTNLQGAVALAQVERLDEILKKRKQIEQWYNEELNCVPEIRSLKRDVVWCYDILVEDRDNLMDCLKHYGIETRVFFKPMSQQPIYYNEEYKNLKANEFAKSGLYLPTYNSLTQKDVKFISSIIKKYYEK